MILFFVVSLFSPLLVVLPAALGHNDTPKSMSLLEFDGICVSCSTAALIILHSSTNSQIFSLVVRDSAICPSAR
jgi:hypothetical protein